MNKQEMQDALVSRAASLNEWLSDSSERTIESLMIRKFDCSVVLHGRRLSVDSDGGLDVPVQLLIQQDYKLWSINLMLSIKPLDDIDDEDEIRPAGLLFQVVGEVPGSVIRSCCCGQRYHLPAWIQHWTISSGVISGCRSFSSSLILNSFLVTNR